MKFTTMLVLIVVLLGVVASQAQISANANASKGALAPATATCSYSFTVPGKLNSFMTYCVTVNGNITSFQSPSGFDYLAQGGAAEGYGICDNSTGRAYYDYAFTDTGNWGAPVPISHTTTVVKIARTTSDGLFTLTQTITRVAGPSPYAKVTMALKNNSGITKTPYLVRWADVDPAAAPFTDTSFSESVDASQYSAWAYNEGGLGLMIEELGQPTVPYGFVGLAGTSVLQNPCSPTNSGFQASVDAGVAMLWALQLGPNKTGTVNAKYTQF
ncbi:MAG TPA: hypothetical protein VMT53_03700 [Terriglobales bacterium]|nr:hypothetical protein [Terriglobales bacterium]